MTERDDALKRIDQALKAALKMPPRKHKDEPKRTKVASGPPPKSVEKRKAKKR